MKKGGILTNEASLLTPSTTVTLKGKKAEVAMLASVDALIKRDLVIPPSVLTTILLRTSSVTSVPE